jgi:mevalonate kinase
MVEASAPGKCILFGEHAVVFGQPAVAVAIEQRIHVKIEPSIDEHWRLEGTRLDAKKHPHLNTLRHRLWPTADGAPPLSIRILGDIPRASGLGSSAAMSVAACAALRMARGRWMAETRDGTHQWAEGYSHSIEDTDPYATFDDNKAGLRPTNYDNRTHLLKGLDALDVDECAVLGHAVEAAAQGGRASPMDASTCAHGGIVLLSDAVESGAEHLYQRKLEMSEGLRTWELHKLPIPVGGEELFLVIGNTGIHAPTAAQVAKVAQAIQNDSERIKEIETIGTIARRGIAALKSGDYEAVGRAMTENQIMLRGLGVSCPELDHLVRAAAPSSLGAKLTGAGGGGCMVALTYDPKTTSEAIELAGGRTLISKFGNAGVKIEMVKDAPLWSPDS